jgi:Ca2+-binding RTX toxin-like protein
MSITTGPLKRIAVAASVALSSGAFLLSGATPQALATNAVCDAAAQDPDAMFDPGTALTQFRGTTGDDVIIGSSGIDDIDGRGGDDLICGMGGADWLSGGVGAESVSGGDKSDDI